MLVHYDGSRVKLSAEYAQQEVENSTQGQMQPLNQQAKPVLPKNTQPAAGMQQAAPAAQPMTPKIRNPTLERMGIQMPDPKPATVTSTKLSKLSKSVKSAQYKSMEQRLKNFKTEADGRTVSNLDKYEVDPLLMQTLKGRDYYDSVYLPQRESVDLKLRAPQKTRFSKYQDNLYGGTGALVAGALPLLQKGISPTSLLASTILGAGGYLLGSGVSKEINSRKLRANRYHLQTTR
jgi:hypothetical protein